MSDPMLARTRICDLFGITTPILNAPMGGGDAPGELAAAVSRAGGLGMIGGTTVGDTQWLVEQIRRARDLTDRPFGVGLLSQRPNCERLMHAALDEGVKVIGHSFADPTPFVAPAHDAGALVICQVRTLAAAVQAAKAGVDVVTAQGTEAGGHTGFVSTLALVPAVVSAVAPVPVVAAGGIGDGRAIAAALLLGAEGVWIGTRFLATRESGVSEAHKAAVIGASADDTILTDVFDIDAGTSWPADVSGRAIRDEFSDQWHAREQELRELVERDGSQHASSAPGAPTRAFWAGEASGFVTGREEAGEVVVNLARDAAAVLAARSAALLGRSWAGEQA
ncbi:MAG TPA: nitronate monooxygenase [Acidimicrobiia bacterium]|nr:nitronate monooxygenase [Acidimicrobiia bacterium]